MKELKLTQQEKQLLRNALYTLRDKIIKDYDANNLNSEYTTIHEKINFIEYIIDIDQMVKKLEGEQL